MSLKVDVAPAANDSAPSQVKPPSSSSTDALMQRVKEHSIAHLRYKLEGEVARGGMGAILRVWDTDLRRHLAMKVILGATGGDRGGATDAPDEPDEPDENGPRNPRAAPAVDSKLLARFLEEAQVTSQLDHPLGDIDARDACACIGQHERDVAGARRQIDRTRARRW